ARSVLRSMVVRWFLMVLGVLTTAGPAALWLLGGYLVVTRAVSVGLVVAFATVLLTRFYNPVAQIAALHVSVVGSLALFQRLFECLDLPVEITDRPGARALGVVRGVVAFGDVTFAYGPGPPPLAPVALD